jgi:hypothetical protein
MKLYKGHSSVDRQTGRLIEDEEKKNTRQREGEKKNQE